MSRDDPEGGRSLITNPDDDAFSTLMSFKQSRAAGRTSPVQAAETQQARIHESEKFRARFRREARWTLDPTSRRMARWDIVTSVALVFTATVTPFEVCVLPAVPLKEMITDPLSWLNRFVDLIFLTDVIIQSMMRYEENGVTVYDSRKIFMHYARSWMAVDILTAIPVDMLTAVWDEANGWVAEDGSGEENPNAGTGSSAFELVRMIRLVKLGRIIRASRNFRRWQAYLGLSFSFIALIKFAILTTMMAHWLACMWILVGRSQIHTLSHGVQSAYHDDPHAAFGSNWVTKARLNDATPRQLYSVALYIALSNIFSGSSGNIVPASPLEYNMQTVMMLVGSAVWAYVITSGCGILATLDPYGVMYRHQMDELNYFAKDKNLPKEMLWKLREFLTQTQEVQRQARYDLLLDNMSERLKADAALCWARSSLMKVHYFSSGTEDGFLASAALSLKLRVFCRSEQIPVSSLLIIDRGIAARKGRIHLKGSCLGEDMILSSDRFRDFAWHRAHVRRADGPHREAHAGRAARGLPARAQAHSLGGRARGTLPLRRLHLARGHYGEAKQWRPAGHDRGLLQVPRGSVEGVSRAAGAYTSRACQDDQRALGSRRGDTLVDAGAARRCECLGARQRRGPRAARQSSGSPPRQARRRRQQQRQRRQLF